LKATYLTARPEWKSLIVRRLDGTPQELENAADAIADISQADLQSLLRRAAVRCRSTDDLTFDPDVDVAIDLLATGLRCAWAEVIQTILRDWLVATGSGRPANTLDEDSETDGSA
jgi:hypothetical protein